MKNINAAINRLIKRFGGAVPAVLLACLLSLEGGGMAVFAEESPVIQAFPALEEEKPDAGPVSAAEDMDFDVNAFLLPDEAEVLVIVEGTGGSDCSVYAFEKENGNWVERVSTYGYLGENGMSDHRSEGDKTTPIGVFLMNTPFGQKEALEGFPENYIMVTPGYFWTDTTNKLTNDPAYWGDGEAVGTEGYSGYYDYAIDAGFNPLGIPGQGSALFIHCIGHNKEYTSGCVAIPEEDMVTIMRLYGSHGDGTCFIAQAPAGTFDQIYDTFGVNNGLSPKVEY